MKNLNHKFDIPLQFESTPVEVLRSRRWFGGEVLEFYSLGNGQWRTVALRHGFLILVSGTPAAMLWFPRPYHFTLRALFVVTAFPAVVLGVIVEP